MEIIDIIIMSIVLGVIFSDIARIFRSPYSYSEKGFDWDGFKFAVMATAPAIILHEFGHKFVAMAFGLNAVFNAAYGWLGFGMLLKILNTGLIFFVPAYVSITGNASPLVYSGVAFVGPGVNLILWLGSGYILKKNLVNKKYHSLLYLTKQINMLLFIFNMLPIPMFDGFKVYSGVLKTIF